MNYNGLGLPAAASTYAKEIDFGLWLIHAAMLGIFVLWGIFFAYLLFRYRQRPGVAAEREDHETPASITVPDSLSKFPFAQLLYKHQGEIRSLLPDMIVMVFEIALIVFYAIPVWNRIKIAMPTDDPSAYRVDIIAEQFAWNAHYPGADGKFGPRKPELVHFSNAIGLDRSDPAAADDIVMGNELRLPVNRKALIRLTSKDVIHSFFVPEFRIKQDAMPGMEIPMWVEPTLPGHYELACAQLCGFGHALMRGDVYVETEADHQKWLQSRLKLAAPAKKAVNPSEDF